MIHTDGARAGDNGRPKLSAMSRGFECRILRRCDLGGKGEIGIL